MLISLNFASTSLILYYGDPFTFEHKGNTSATNIHVTFDLTILIYLKHKAFLNLVNPADLSEHSFNYDK